MLNDDKINRDAFQKAMQDKFPENTTLIASLVQECSSKVDSNLSDCEPKKFIDCFHFNYIQVSRYL